MSRNISLEITGPQKICITGKNGAGKSTLLKAIAEMLLQRENLRVFYMPQNYEEALALEQTPVEYLSVTGQKDEKNRIGTYLGSLKYTAQEMNHPVRELSGGQKAKLLFLKMSMEGYQVLILDEPTRNLSPLSAPVIRELLKNYGEFLSACPMTGNIYRRCVQRCTGWIRPDCMKRGSQTLIDKRKGRFYDESNLNAKEKKCMNKKVMKYYEETARSLGLSLDTESGAIYGRRSDFDLVIYAASEGSPHLLTVVVSAGRSGGPLTREECKQFSKENKSVSMLQQKENVISMVVKTALTDKGLKNNLEESINALIGFLRLNGFQNRCQICGSQGETDSVRTGLSYMHLCPECFEKFRSAKAADTSRKEAVSENVVGGIIGALAGSLLGVLCIVVFGQLGYVSAVSGIVMAVCAMKGYEKLGRKLSGRGAAICILIMFVMTYVGNHLDWTVVCMREVGLDPVTAWQSVSVLLAQGALGTAYWANLGLVYVFALLGAVPMVQKAIKKQKEIDHFYRLGSGNML